MKGSHRTGWFGLFAFICLALVTRPAAVSPNVVISQVYGGGGNSGAPFTHDFIELFNRGSAPASLSGWSLQYASSTGTGSFGATSGQHTTLPDITDTLGPPDHKMVDISVPDEARDPAGAPVCSVDVSSNEATDGRGDGHTATDWQVLGAHAVRLRAERAGLGTSRIYTLTISCTDSSGNASIATGTVSVGRCAETGQPAGWGSGR